MPPLFQQSMAEGAEVMPPVKAFLEGIGAWAAEYPGELDLTRMGADLLSGEMEGWLVCVGDALDVPVPIAAILMEWSDQRPGKKDMLLRAIGSTPYPVDGDISAPPVEYWAPKMLDLVREDAYNRGADQVRALARTGWAKILEDQTKVLGVVLTAEPKVPA